MWHQRGDLKLVAIQGMNASLGEAEFKNTFPTPLLSLPLFSLSLPQSLTP
ncbi:MAG: hypothetical protein ACKESB_03340 [Candidatus Hodgkinia cicadicola]